MRNKREVRPPPTDPKLDDGALASQVVAGSRWALTELYRRYGQVVRGVALRLLRSEADADDATQDVFLGLEHSLRSFRARGSFEGWLRKVTLTTALMRLRKRRQRAEVALGMEGSPVFRTVGSDPALKLSLEQAITVLPEILRVVFVLKDVEGYSHDEIAELLGIESRTSRVRLYRARKKLRAHLELP